MHLLLLTALIAQAPDTVRLPDVVSTASRIVSASGSAFAVHTVITRQELAERGAAQLLDVLRDVPGLVVVQAGSRGTQASVFLRGGESDFVRVLVDGVAVNSPGGWFNIAHLSTANVDRIEVVRGPGSVLHGSDAMAGVIQVFTREGRGPVRPDVKLEAGGQASRHVAVGLAGAGAAGTMALEASSTRTAGFQPFNSRYRHEEVSGRFATVAGRPWSAVATIRIEDSRAGFPTDGNGVPADSNQYTTEERITGGLVVSRRLAGGPSLQVSGSLSRAEEGFRNAMDSPGDTVGYGFQARSDGRALRSGLDMRLIGIRAGALDATAGLAYEDERQRSRSSASSNFGFGVGTESDTFRAARSTRAGYAELGAEVGAGVTLAAAGRVDDNSAFGALTSWRVGIAAPLPGAAVLHAQVGRAFKAPTFSELFANSPFEVGNRDLRPEVANSWEVGVRLPAIQQRVRLASSLFSQRFGNLIQYASAAPGAPTYANVGVATSRGVEVEVGASVLRTLTLSASGTRLWTRIRENGGSTAAALAIGAPLVRRPEVSGAAALRWAPSDRATARLGVHYLGPRDDIDYRGFPATRIRLPGRTLVTLSSQLAIPGLPAGLAATVRVENLLDTAWEQALGFPGQGRLLHLGVRTTR